MPLKVSSQGWVKVAAPKRPRKKRQIDPVGEKEALCSPLRYFACQAVDPNKERLRMLGDRVVYSNEQEDCLRPGSRMERTSTLDEWRYDVIPPRSASRLSGNTLGDSSPLKSDMLGGNRGNSGSDRDHQRSRGASAPIVISRSPPPSAVDDDEGSKRVATEIEGDADNASVAYTETRSERHCRHRHRHQMSVKPRAVIPEEEDEVLSQSSTASPRRNPVGSGQDTCTLNVEQNHDEDATSSTPTKRRQSSKAGSNPSTSFHISNQRSHRAGRDGPETSDLSSGSSHLTRSSRTTPSCDVESQSSYSGSVRSASPVHKSRNTYYHDREDRESHYPSPPSSPPPSNRKHCRESSLGGRHTSSYGDGCVTAPVTGSGPPPPLSQSTWTNSHNSRSRSSAPSIDGYQFQAAIFQPKNNYKGYRAPSLSKGNRWETATSALSFD